MLNRKNKKGFTLAELLIVVAIIAVLVAIAVPLFVGALNDADKRVQEANERAVRGVAVEKILTDETFRKTDKGEEADYWYIDALVDAGGNISKLQIIPHKNDKPGEVTITDNLEFKDKTNNQYHIAGTLALLNATK